MLDFFKKLFKKEAITPASDNVVTAPLSETQIQSIKAMATNRFEPAQFLVASAQSVGRQRELNEDSLFTLTSTIAGNSSNPPSLFGTAHGTIVGTRNKKIRLAERGRRTRYGGGGGILAEWAEVFSGRAGGGCCSS